MEQFSKNKSVFFHLYPGIAATIVSLLLTPHFVDKGYPPQFGLLIVTGGTVLFVLLLHLFVEKERNGLKNLHDLNGLTKKLPVRKLIFISSALIFLAVVIWAVTQSLNEHIGDKLFNWLPEWYRPQDLSEFDTGKVKITLVLNLFLNGLFVPLAEELYFRGYLLPRMKVWGNSAFVINALFYSLYHFWQPYVCITLFLALLPMTFAAWKTKNLKLAIITHCVLNVAGALLSFGFIFQK